MPTNKPRLNLTLEPETLDKSKQIAQSQGLTPSDWVKGLIQKAIAPNPEPEASQDGCTPPRKTDGMLIIELSRPDMDWLQETSRQKGLTPKEQAEKILHSVLARKGC